MKDALLRGKDAHIEDLKLAGSINQHALPPAMPTESGRKRKGKEEKVVETAEGRRLVWY